METEVDTGLQPERTGLAWSRTLVALAGCVGLLCAHALHEGTSLAVVGVACLIAGSVLVLAWWIAHARSGRAQAHMSASVSPTQPQLILLACAATAVVGLTAFAYIVITG